MRLDDLEVFLALLQHGHQQRAAETLGMTQSALSKALARLEAHMGLRLFERTPKGLVPTRAGEAVEAEVRKVRLGVKDLEATLDAQRAGRNAKVYLGTVPYLLHSLVMPLLARFFVQRPLATFKVETHLSAQLMAMLRTGEVDLTLAALPATLPADIGHHPLGPLHMQIVAGSDHPRLPDLRQLSDLAQERWALPSSALYLRQWLEEKFAAAQLPAPRVAVESSASPVAFAQLLRHSDLLSLVPSRVLGQPEGQGLTALPGTDMAWSHDLALCWRREAPRSPLCQDFQAAILEWCADNGI